MSKESDRYVPENDKFSVELILTPAGEADDWGVIFQGLQRSIESELELEFLRGAVWCRDEASKTGLHVFLYLDVRASEKVTIGQIEDCSQRYLRGLEGFMLSEVNPGAVFEQKNIETKPENGTSASGLPRARFNPN